MSRRKGRILALQALYAFEVGAMSLEDICVFEWTEGEGGAGKAADDERAFAQLIVTGAAEHISEIDSQIKKYLSPNWEFDRLNKVSLAILRMGVYSLLYQKDMPSSIVIDEAVTIAKEFGIEDSHKFINAILDKINKVNSGCETSNAEETSDVVAKKTESIAEAVREEEAK